LVNSEHSNYGHGATAINMLIAATAALRIAGFDFFVPEGYQDGWGFHFGAHLARETSDGGDPANAQVIGPGDTAFLDYL